VGVGNVGRVPGGAPRLRRRVGRITAGAVDGLRRLGATTRPQSRELEQHLAERWGELPAHARHSAQTLGRRGTGCEATRGVFPSCDLACTPCYHGKDANRVRIDGAHTVREADRQMAFSRAMRGSGQNAQLIGGEVSLLAPDDHAAALQAMQRHTFKVMSFSHGDFSYDYLRRLALAPDGRPRFRSLIFAGHFDSLMLGRRGIPVPSGERGLNPFRAWFVAKFRRLEAEHGVRFYLAHNMTVTPRNLEQIPDVLRSCGRFGFRMLSFQPAAFQGNSARWKESYRAITADDVWSRIERGVGARVPYRLFQTGDERCNRAAYGGFVGDRWVPLLDDRDPRDLRVRDAFFRTLRGMDVQVGPALLAARLGRALARRPAALPLLAAWLPRFVRRAGLRSLLRERFAAVTLVMHRFMDQDEVARAWELMERGESATDPRIAEAQERLAACSYHFPHPDTGRLVPGCAQHAVYDPVENAALARALPRRREPD
jgi:hypothetical protein